MRLKSKAPDQTKKVFNSKLKTLVINGTPGRIRTCGLRIRSPLLYPTELQALKENSLLSNFFLNVHQNVNFNFYLIKYIAFLDTMIMI